MKKCTFYRKQCKFSNCLKPVLAKGYCGGHYRQYHAGENLRPLRFLYTGCSFPGCDEKHHSRGLCEAHYAQFRRGSILHPVGWRPPRSRKIGKDGYVRLYHPESPHSDKHGQVLEHRLVMAEHLKRRLHKDETVHHKNGVRHDNRLKNLELWVKSHPTGQRVEDVVAWARAMLTRYDQEYLLGLPPRSHYLEK